MPTSVHLLLQLALPSTLAYVQIADGTYYQSGSFSSTYRWQSSGLLSSGGCNYNTIQIRDCYSMYLNSTGMLESTKAPPTLRRRETESVARIPTAQLSRQDAAERAAKYDDDLLAYYIAFPEQLTESRAISLLEDDYENFGAPTRTTPGNALAKRQVQSQCGGTTSPPPPPGSTPLPPTPPSPRQRIELFSWPGATFNTTWKYEWKSYLAPKVSTSFRFFHLMQVLRRDACGGPVFTLDALNGRVTIVDNIRECKKLGTCPSTPIENFWGKTLVNSMTITWGLQGRVDYRVFDFNNPSIDIIRYVASGDMGNLASIKFGLYRAADVPGLSAARAFVGEYSAVRLAAPVNPPPPAIPPPSTSTSIRPSSTTSPSLVPAPTTSTTPTFRTRTASSPIPAITSTAVATTATVSRRPRVSI